jgi:hypothetical protein
MIVKNGQNLLNSEQLSMVNHAVSVSEEVISDYYHLTISSWKKYRYDIKTLKDLRPEEIAPEVFAQIVRCARPAPPDGMRTGDFYRICIQDHNIIHALKRDARLKLSPLLIYIITHELVHLIRFYKFFQSFDAYEPQRSSEEVRVHQLTHEVLSSIKIPGMDIIFAFYADHRHMV